MWLKLCRRLIDKTRFRFSNKSITKLFWNPISSCNFLSFLFVIQSHLNLAWRLASLLFFLLFIHWFFVFKKHKSSYSRTYYWKPFLHLQNCTITIFFHFLLPQTHLTSATDSFQSRIISTSDTFFYYRKRKDVVIHILLLISRFLRCFWFGFRSECSYDLIS